MQLYIFAHVDMLINGVILSHFSHIITDNDAVVNVEVHDK